MQAAGDIATISEFMNSLVSFTIKEETKREIDKLAHMTGKQGEAVLRELVETGLEYKPQYICMGRVERR